MRAEQWTVRAPRIVWLAFSVALVLSNIGLWYLGAQLQLRVAAIDAALMAGTAVTEPVMWHRRFDALHGEISRCCSVADVKLLPEMGRGETDEGMGD